MNMIRLFPLGIVLIAMLWALVPDANSERLRITEPPQPKTVRGAIDRWGPDRIGIHRTRPCPLCGIPGDYDYRVANRSQANMALSTVGILVNRPSIPGSDGYPKSPEKGIKYFQLDKPKMAINHCEISRVAFHIHSNGDWVVSLRADQNRQDEQAANEGRLPKAADFRAYLKRNHFVLKLRCYGAYRIGEAAADRSTGKPLLFALDPPPFVVESGEPFDYQFNGHDAVVRDMFAIADRVEVEFFYETDRTKP